MSAYITCITYVGTEFGQEPNYFFSVSFWRLCLCFWLWHRKPIWILRWLDNYDDDDDDDDDDDSCFWKCKYYDLTAIYDYCMVYYTIQTRFDSASTQAWCRHKDSALRW